MNLTRAIAVSFLAHAAILAYAFVQFEPGAPDLTPTSSFSGLVVDYERAEMDFAMPDVPDRESTEEGARSELVSMDLESGLDGNPETTPGGESEPAAAESESMEQPEPEEPEPTQQQESAEPEPEEPESADGPSPEEPSEQQEPSEEPEDSTDEAVLAQEDRESPAEAAESEADPQAEPTESDSSAESSGGDETDGEKRVAGRGTAEESGSGEGAGSGSEAGTGGGGTGDEGSGRSGIDRGKLIREYTRSLHRLLAAKKYYPRAAERAGIEGTVEIEVTIDGDGEILAVELHESSGHEILDEAALDIMRSIDKLPAPPEALAWSKKRLHVPIPYGLDSRG